MSDLGSDDNDCHTELTPCKNLQTVLDRAQDGADIYVTSDTLSLDLAQAVLDEVPYKRLFGDYSKTNCCLVASNMSFSVRSTIQLPSIQLTCSHSKLPWLLILLSILHRGLIVELLKLTNSLLFSCKMLTLFPLLLNFRYNLVEYVGIQKHHRKFYQCQFA